MKAKRLCGLPGFLAAAHLLVLAIFLFAYRSSQDPNRGLSLLFWLPIDPLAMLGVIFLPLFASYESSDAWAFGILAVLGTLQWYLIGRFARWLWRGGQSPTDADSSP